jgi:hypothetical protein
VDSKKSVYIAFAIEDRRERDILKSHPLPTSCLFEYLDIAVKQPSSTAWQENVRTMIRQADGLIVMASSNSLTSVSQAWEINCAKEENRRIHAIWAKADDRPGIHGLNIGPWSWAKLQVFIESL